ncbi:MAG: hypothetical protein JKX85_00405, partial [Phycisphaeraceae bacterium]|nr:hypothetical protein [Phycisphaeraceae bacterium]
TLKAPQLTLPTTVSSSSTSKPVTISNDAPRQLVIRKPQPGDDLPLIAKSVPVVVTPQQLPRVASAVVGRVSRATPPIPDTETPPVYTNWPLMPTAASATSSHSPADSRSMRELAVDKLVIDKPVVEKAVVRNRLDGPAPVKPALPQVPAMTPAKSPPPMPRFPNKMPQVTVATTSAEINTLPPIAAPPEASREVAPKVALELAPELAPVVVDVPVVVTVPTVNPLLASRGHFQPQSTMLSDLEQRLIDAHQLPLNQRPLAKMLAAYQAVAKQSQLPIRDQRIVQARMVQLKRDIRLNHALNKISSAQTSISGSTPFSQSFTPAPPVAAANAPWVPAHFDIVGQLLASAVYDGQNLPRLYRLVNPADGRVTLAYIRPNDQINPSVHLGRVVGILGKPEMDQTLRLNVIAPQKIVIFQVAP